MHWLLCVCCLPRGALFGIVFLGRCNMACELGNFLETLDGGPCVVDSDLIAGIN
jgi:hypothetical protein